MKRLLFPRFYFLSNDELLDVLAHGRNPASIQPHLSKCFANIRSLDIRSKQDKTEELKHHHQPPIIKNIVSAEGEIMPMPKYFIIMFIKCTIWFLFYKSRFVVANLVYYQCLQAKNWHRQDNINHKMLSRIFKLKLQLLFKEGSQYLKRNWFWRRFSWQLLNHVIASL